MQNLPKESERFRKYNKLHTTPSTSTPNDYRENKPRIKNYKGTKKKGIDIILFSVIIVFMEPSISNLLIY